MPTRRDRWRLAIALSALLPVAAVVSSCADVIGLDHVDRVACTLDCDAQIGGGGVDAFANRDASTGRDAARGGDGSGPWVDSGHHVLLGHDGSTVSSDGGGTPDSSGPPQPDTGTSNCVINGTTFAAGAVNPANACQSCQFGKSQWRDLPNGTSCGATDICTAGACAPGCYLGGISIPASTVNPANKCQSCQPAASTSQWSSVSDGTSCGTDEFCTSGSCSAPGCFVGGAFEAAGSPDPSNPCKSCQPGVSTSAFGNVGDGTVCGGGTLCNAGSCVAECDVAGTFFTAGQADGSNPCMTCQPATSATTLTAVADGTACGGACGTCAGGNCANATLLANGAPCSTSAQCCDNSCNCPMSCGKDGCSCSAGLTCGG